MLCYCLLTNHVHLLLETPKGNLSKMMQAFQTSYTVYFNKRHGRSGHVFEQRYKAFLVDRENYLLQVSRYIHLNPVAAKMAGRAQDYRWSSYREYLRDARGGGLSKGLILGCFSGRGRARVSKYREFVEGAVKKRERWKELPVIKQGFVGDEDFVEQAKKEARSFTGKEASLSFKDILTTVCKVSGVEAEELRRPLRSERVQRGREILVYISRRRSDISLRELVRFLGVKELSTVSHGLRRAEERLRDDLGFRQQVESALKKLAHSPMQA
ncbi:MAG: helix-turn-helix domain-containing protein [Candidatus Binatia bacterium]